MKIKALLLILALLLPAIVHTAPGILWDNSRSTWFYCTMSSTAVVLTEITGCGVLTTGQTRYITSIQVSSSINSTTVNFLTLQFGTGATCGTGTTTFWQGQTGQGSTNNPLTFETPIKTAANAALCFVNPGVGTRYINIQGYIAQ